MKWLLIGWAVCACYEPTAPPMADGSWPVIMGTGLLRAGVPIALTTETQEQCEFIMRKMMRLSSKSEMTCEELK